MTEKPFSNDKDLISIEVYKVKYQSSDAILVIHNEKEIWLPKSQLEDWPDIGTGGEILMPEWLAEEKGMI